MKSAALGALATALSLMLVQWWYGVTFAQSRQLELPSWFWLSVVLTGLLGVAGRWLILQAHPEMPFWKRAALLGLGWGLPLGSWMMSGDALRGITRWELSLPMYLIGAAIYGVIMATIQQRRTP